MVRASGEVTILRPVQEVFAYLADPTRIPRWRPDIVAATPRTGHGVGAQYRETMQFMGVKHQTFEVVEFEPGRRLAVRAVDGLSLRPLQRYVLTTEGGGTRVKYEVELPVTGWFRLMTPMLATMIPGKWRGYAERLRRSLEAPPT